MQKKIRGGMPDVSGVKSTLNSRSLMTYGRTRRVLVAWFDADTNMHSRRGARQRKEVERYSSCPLHEPCSSLRYFRIRISGAYSKFLTLRIWNLPRLYPRPHGAQTVGGLFFSYLGVDRDTSQIRPVEQYFPGGHFARSLRLGWRLAQPW